jgi:hypothetical protein
MCAQAAAKERQRSNAALANAAREKERARVQRALPGWSLPALQTLNLNGCRAFARVGLNRLLANAPQVTRSVVLSRMWVLAIVGSTSRMFTFVTLLILAMPCTFVLFI